MTYQTDDLRIDKTTEVASPAEIHTAFPITEKAAETIYKARQSIHSMLNGKDDRLLVITGPCSVHDLKAAQDYANRLQELNAELKDDLLIIMRVYFEKPRTTVGWKGLINDPDLDGSFHINKGLLLARELLSYVNNLGIPAGTEYLDPISPQYISDLISWGAIGARTTESQVHRELASGLSCPVGFKNGTDGGLQVAIDAIRASSQPHHFMSLTKAGHSAIFTTTGNVDGHLILRGGTRPNYDTESVNIAAENLIDAGLAPHIMIDLSHANSRKKHAKQIDVGRDVAGQVARGDQRIFGVMIESFLTEGRQDWKQNKTLTYGQSLTDACISWENTAPLLRQLAQAVQDRRDTV